MTAEQVFAIVKQIPAGRVTTYGAIARAIGSPRGARQVGRLLHTNRYPGVVPCHRVVFADGSLSPALFADGSLSPAFAFGGENVQREWLIKEGVPFVGDKADIASCFFGDFQSEER